MAASNPPTKAAAFEFSVPMKSWASPGLFQDSPTIAAGDFQISKDGGAYANLTNLPTNSPAGSEQVEVVLTTTETNCDRWVVRWKDQTVPPEWVPDTFTVLTTA